jgi:hypothetical protein
VIAAPEFVVVPHCPDRRGERQGDQCAAGAGHVDERAAIDWLGAPGPVDIATPVGACESVRGCAGSADSAERAADRMIVFTAWRIPTIVAPSSTQTRKTYSRRIHSS